MRNQADSKTTEAISKEQTVESSKLVSLLALAAGAVAMPETGNANVVYTNLGANYVVVSTNSPSFTIQLPGVAQLGFLQSTTSKGVRRIRAEQAAGYVRLKTNAYFAVHVHVSNTATNPVAWSQIRGSHIQTDRIGTVGAANATSPNPTSFDHDYLPFEFMDSTQTNRMLYGWVDISLNNSALNSGAGPIVSIWRYAYDDSGTQILMGQTVAVPEPASVSLMALGALALGARGVRAWRKNRAAS
jgi:hypothetical protein